MCMVLGALFMMLRVRRVLRWLQAGTAALLGVAAVSGLGLLWWDGHEQELDRMFWSLVVVTWAGAVGTLVLGRLYPAKGENVAARGMRVVCPRCLLEQDMAAGEGRCEQCKMKFKIWVEV